MYYTGDLAEDVFGSVPYQFDLYKLKPRVIRFFDIHKQELLGSLTVASIFSFYTLLMNTFTLLNY